MSPYAAPMIAPTPRVPVRDFLGLRRDDDGPWELPVTRRVVSGLGTLWGGCGLAAAVEAMEDVAGRPCAWAAVQYLRPIVPGDVLVLDVVLGRQGRAVTQAQVHGRVRGELVLAGLGSLGGSGDLDLQFAEPPADVPPPDECAPRTMPLELDFSGTIIERFEQRWAQAPRAGRTDGVPGTGTTRVWMRLLEPVETTSAALAVLADLAPSALSEAVGVRVGGVSLDNTIRVARAASGPEGGAAGDWVLLDLTVEAVVADIGQISARLFAEDGRLLAVAGQSAVLKRVDGGR